MNDARHPLDQLPDLAVGRLDPATAAQIDGHLQSCAQCRAELAELQALADALAPDQAVEPQPGTLASVLDRLPAAGPEPGHAPGDSPLVDLGQARAARRRSRRPVAAGLVAAAAALLAFVTVAVVTNDSGDDEPEATAPGPDDPSAQQVLLAAASTTSELETLQTTMSGDLQLTPDLGDVEMDGLTVSLHLEGEQELAFPDRAHTSITIEAVDGPATGLFEDTRFEQIIVGQDVWVRTDGGPWEPQATGEGELLDLPSLEEPAQLLEQAAEDAEALQDGGIVEIDGVETRQVSFTVPSSLVGLDAVLEEDDPVGMTVYIGPDDHLRRAEISLEAPIEVPIPGTMVMDITIDYVAFDVPVDIEPPDGED